MINISLGENCLIDILLNKYKLKKESFTFGSVRTNIEYDIEIIKQNFAGFLDKKNLQRRIIYGKKVVFNNLYKNIHDVFNNNVSNGFEFTHHNVLDNKNDRDSYIRKIKRFRKVLKNNDITFWYHYRYSKKNNLKMIIKIFESFNKYLKNTFNRSYKFIILSQICEKGEKKFELTSKGNIFIFKCYDNSPWEGENMKAISFNTIFKEIIDYITKNINNYECNFVPLEKKL